MLTSTEVVTLCNDLINLLSSNKQSLINLNKKTTVDTNYYINKDFETVLFYLKSLKKQIKSQTSFKPKGKILLILPYNEPFIMTIIPVLNSLICGNTVLVKMSRRADKFFKKVWFESGVVAKNDLNLKRVDSRLKTDSHTFDKIISKVNAVYFFGSLSVAKKVYVSCAKQFKEFYPELEGADAKVFYYGKKIGSKAINRDAKNTLLESFSHSGQSCQRLQGIYVDEKNFDEYLESLKQEFSKLLNNEYEKFISKDFKVNPKYYSSTLDKIKKSKPHEVIKHDNKFPLLVVNPSPSSIFVNEAYFFPTIWIIPVKSTNQLIKFLNSRKFFLGLNVFSNTATIKSLISETNFARYTIKCNHTTTNHDLGWGGNYPTGFRGYTDWTQYFNNPFTIIKNKEYH